MVQAIIFDVGGVYLQGSFVDFVNKSYKVLGINGQFHASDEVVFDTNLNRGTVTHEDCFRRYFGVPISDEQMEAIKGLWTTTWVLTEETSDLVGRLKERYTLAILSNSDALNSEKYQQRGWYSPFEHLVLSHEVGVLKPDRRIYEIALQRLKFYPEKCLFIDDQKKCLEPAKVMGMKTILYQTHPQLKEELTRMGIKF